MKPLLALFTCHAYNYDMHGTVYGIKNPKVERRPAVKATWLRDVDIDYRWFFGRQDTVPVLPKHDEVFLDCPDGYYYVSSKAQAIARWALEHGYDRVFKVDDDTYVDWARFKQRPIFADAEYSGGCWPESSFAYGGAYGWAGRLLEAVASRQIPSGVWWSDDTWIGSLAKELSIPFVRDETFHFGRIDQGTCIQSVDDALLFGECRYTTYNPMTPDQMVRYHEFRKQHEGT